MTFLISEITDDALSFQLPVMFIVEVKCTTLSETMQRPILFPPKWIMRCVSLSFWDNRDRANAWDSISREYGTSPAAWSISIYILTNLTGNAKTTIFK